MCGGGEGLRKTFSCHVIILKATLNHKTNASRDKTNKRKTARATLQKQVDLL